MERFNQHSVESNVQPLGANIAERLKNGAEGDPLLLELREATSPLGEYINALPEDQVKIFAHEVLPSLDVSLDIDTERSETEQEVLKSAIAELVQIPDKETRKGMVRELTRLLQA
jgi:hypothetical protein